jgi:UDP-N-acetylmuramoyl-L-alanyl-D-glutamate--2,6-diaminopimelate ligase/murE/murF fusion protein
MKLSTLLNEIGRASGTPGTHVLHGDPEIKGVFCNAQEVRPGGLFVAIKGFKADGHDYIHLAIDNGAVAVIRQRPVQAGADVEVVTVDDSRRALAEVSAAYYGHPSKAMTVVGITGTNGKTTTSYLVESILKAAGQNPGVIGTINYRFGGHAFDNPVTTPESLDLQRILNQMRDAAVTHAVMEVSSHALDLHRAHGCHFDVAVFTNFSQDHLDYHQDMDSYWAAKRKLFVDLLPASDSSVKRAVINIDSLNGAELVGQIDVPCLTCGSRPTQDLHAVTARFDLNGIDAVVKTPLGDMEIHSPLVGRHNLENILSAIGVGIALEISVDAITAGINSLDNVPGRLERIPNDCGRYIYVDYAHTPDALENALLALRALTADRIICVFGCGGDRDRAKRPQMGAIAARLSDLILVTSDNPRSEPPERIIEEIVEGVHRVSQLRYSRESLENGFHGKGYGVVADRREAIGLSVRASRTGDTILIAGKGHEPYQLIGQQRLPFDDRLEARSAVKDRHAMVC